MLIKNEERLETLIREKVKPTKQEILIAMDKLVKKANGIEGEVRIVTEEDVDEEVINFIQKSFVDADFGVITPMSEFIAEDFYSYFSDEFIDKYMCNRDIPERLNEEPFNYSERIEKEYDLLL